MLARPKLWAGVKVHISGTATLKKKSFADIDDKLMQARLGEYCVDNTIKVPLGLRTMILVQDAKSYVEPLNHAEWRIFVAM